MALWDAGLDEKHHDFILRFTGLHSCWFTHKQNGDTVDGCEILHHQKDILDGWNPKKNGINHRFQLVQDFAGPSTVW